MKVNYYYAGENCMSKGISLRISIAALVWVSFCSYLLVIPELFNTHLSGIHVKLLDMLSIAFLLFFWAKLSRLNTLPPPAIASYRRLLYFFVLFIAMSSLYGFAVNGFPGGFIAAGKIVFQQIWPLIQVLLFFNLGLVLSHRLRFGENLFSYIVSFIALADILINIGKLDIVHFSRPLAPQSMLFVFCYLLILERWLVVHLDDRKSNTLYLFCMLIVNFIAIMLSVTRTALGAVVIGTVLMLMQKLWSNKIKLKYIFSALVIAIILFGIALKLGLIEAFIYRSFNLEDSERIMIWLDAWRMFMEKPLMGVGVGYYINNSLIDNIDLIGGISVENIDMDMIQIASAHNTYLNCLATTGIIGFFFYLTILKKTMSLIYTQLREVDWIKTFFYITFFLSLFQESNFFPSNRYTPLFLTPFWFFLGAKLVRSHTNKVAHSED